MITSASSVLKIKINNKQKHKKFNPPRIVSLTSLPWGLSHPLGLGAPFQFILGSSAPA